MIWQYLVIGILLVFDKKLTNVHQNGDVFASQTKGSAILQSTGKYWQRLNSTYLQNLGGKEKGYKGNNDLSNAKKQALDPYYRFNNMIFSRNNTISCQDIWQKAIPNLDNITHYCYMEIGHKSAQHFGSTIKKNRYNFMHLRLVFMSSHMRYAYNTKCIIQPDRWVWTFPGPKGAKHYLSWPVEYSVWSMGLLNAETRPTEIEINVLVKGNCPVIIGEKNTTERVGFALTNMAARYLGNEDIPEYNESYFCHKTRVYIEGNILYSLCLHVICPLEAIGYRCCHLIWNEKLQQRITSCPSHYFYYDAVWWIYPFILGLMFYAIFPLPLLWLAAELYRWRGTTSSQSSLDTETTPLLPNSSFRDGSAFENKKWINSNPITLCRILSRPLRYFNNRYPIITSKLLRLCAIFLSMSVIGIKVLAHGSSQKDFIVEAVKAGSPMDFLSVLAGYKLSKKDFLPNIGGPFVASGMYLFSLIVLLCIPKDLSKLLARGIPENVSVSTSPLFIDESTINKIGPMHFRLRKGGYRKLYNAMVTQFFLLLNPSFWRYTLTTQCQRYFVTLHIVGIKNSILQYVMYFFYTPCYVAFCLTEIMFCIVYFGIPIIFFAFAVLRAYCLTLWSKARSLNACCRFVAFIFIPFGSFVVLYAIYMFSIVFVDSFIFLSRVAIFTYTGLFAYPKIVYGYIIFTLTVTMYIWESVMHFNQVYNQLFSQSLEVCKSHQTKHECENKIYFERDVRNMIPGNVFAVIVGRLKPIRVEIFRAIVRIMVIALVLYVSVYLLYTFENFKEMSTLTQALTTLTVCMVPKIAKSFCSKNEQVAILREQMEINEIIQTFLRQEEHLIIKHFDNSGYHDDWLIQ